MAYIITGVLAIICIGVIILVIRVYNENQKMGPKKGDYFSDEDDYPLRP